MLDDFAAVDIDTEPILCVQMGVGLDLNGIGFQDRTDLEQAMSQWLPGTTAMTLADADGDLLAVAQGSLSMYHPEDNDSAGSDEAAAGLEDFHDSDDSDDEAGTPNAESTAALGQTLFFASFDQTQSDQQPFEAFADFPQASQSSGATPFEAFATFPSDSTSAEPAAEGGETQEATSQEPAAGDDTFSTSSADILSTLTNEAPEEGSNSQ